MKESVHIFQTELRRLVCGGANVLYIQLLCWDGADFLWAQQKDMMALTQTEEQATGFHYPTYLYEVSTKHFTSHG